MSPVGESVVEAIDRRSRRSEAYRRARKEYRAIRELRKVDPIAAEIRERPYEFEDDCSSWG